MGTVTEIGGNQCSFIHFSFIQQTVTKCLPQAGNKLPSGAGGVHMGGLGGVGWEPILCPGGRVA